MKNFMNKLHEHSLSFKHSITVEQAAQTKKVLDLLDIMVKDKGNIYSNPALFSMEGQNLVNAVDVLRQMHEHATPVQTQQNALPRRVWSMMPSFSRQLPQQQQVPPQSYSDPTQQPQQQMMPQSFSALPQPQQQMTPQPYLDPSPSQQPQQMMPQPFSAPGPPHPQQQQMMMMPHQYQPLPLPLPQQQQQQQQQALPRQIQVPSQSPVVAPNNQWPQASWGQSIHQPGSVMIQGHPLHPQGQTLSPSHQLRAVYHMPVQHQAYKPDAHQLPRNTSHGMPPTASKNRPKPKQRPASAGKKKK
jgi:hypothetical protein